MGPATVLQVVLYQRAFLLQRRTIKTPDTILAFFVVIVNAIVILYSGTPPDTTHTVISVFQFVPHDVPAGEITALSSRLRGTTQAATKSSEDPIGTSGYAE